MVFSSIGVILGAIFALFGIIFRNPVMQLIGGAIFIYALGVLNILPGWMIALLVILFIYLIIGDKK